MPLPVVWHESYEVDIGPHVFPAAKYRLVKERLIAQGVVDPGAIVRPDPVSDDEVRLVHEASYVDRILHNALTRNEELLLEVPFSTALREASWRCAGGTRLAGKLALGSRIAVHLGGGYHHAFPDHGEGFCLINDVAIAIRVLQREGAVRRVAVVDCDVHHGNGTAAIFAQDAEVLTFSIHQENNYPSWKPASDVDVGLADGCGDGEYLAALDARVPALLERHRPELVFYLAGADPYERDQLGGLGLTLEGLRRRDAYVMEAARAAGAAVAVTLAGGYAERVTDTIDIHCNTVREAARVGCLKA